jgi:hypothetical protein
MRDLVRSQLFRLRAKRMLLGSVVATLAAGHPIGLEVLAHRRSSGVRVETPQAARLRGALAADGIASELVGAEVLVAFETTAETVGLVAAQADLVIHEMTSERFQF